MKDKTYSTIKTDNKDTMDIIFNNFADAKKEYRSQMEIVHTNCNVQELDSKLKEISSLYGEFIIQTEQSLDQEDYNKVHLINYQNGKKEYIESKYNYIFEHFRVPDGYTYNEIISMIFNEFEKADKSTEIKRVDCRLKGFGKGVVDGKQVDLMVDMVRLNLDNRYEVTALFNGGVARVDIMEKRTVTTWTEYN